MKNRPLLCVCLVLLFMISVVTAGGGKRFIKELRPSPVELYAKDEENVTVQGTIYRQEQKETYQKIYLKDSRVYLDSNQSRSDIEADTYKKLFQNKKSFKTSNINQVNTQISDIKILICLKSDQKFHIGNKIQLTGEVAFFDNARNPGNFDQRFYYQKQDIHASIWAEHATLIDDRRDGLKDWLADFRMQWKEVLKYELGKQKGAILAAVLLGEKSEMDQDVKELYQANGVGHILAISGVKTLKLDIPLVPETRIKWAFMPLHIAKIYILKLCLDEEIIPRCRFPCSRGYLTKCINQQKKQ